MILTSFHQCWGFLETRSWHQHQLHKVPSTRPCLQQPYKQYMYFKRKIYFNNCVINTYFIKGRQSFESNAEIASSQEKVTDVLQFCPLFFIILYFKKFLWKCRRIIFQIIKWFPEACWSYSLIHSMRHDRLSGWQHEKVMMARCLRFSAKSCCCFQLVFRPLDVS